MFNLNNYEEVLFHIQSRLKRCKKQGSGWYETFCIYCDDAVRKFNPSHGHFHISPSYPFCHCFRCGTRQGLDKFLVDIGFQNQAILQQIKSFSGFTYNQTRLTGISIGESLVETQSKVEGQYSWFIQNNISELNEFFQYVYYRCLDIDPLKFFLFPYNYKGDLQVRFMNYNGELIAGRNIKGKNRYQIIGSKRYYYFQNIMNIDRYENIVVTEGGFDLINLYSYYYPFKDSFFISIGGNNYKGIIVDLINSFLLIGKYNIRVVFDRGLKFQDRIVSSIINQSNILNPEITFEFFLPIVSKDVSEIMMLDKL